MFDILEIEPSGKVYIMDDDDTVNIMKKDGGEVVLNKNNTTFQIVPKGNQENTFVLHDELRGFKKRCLYKKIGKDEYIFADLNCDPDLDINLYVYKKID